ncbi:MAG: GNAT family protein [Arenimonas sp.]|jgi:hypothetical protein
MQLVFGQDELVADWVGVNLGTEILPPYTAIGGTIDGRSLVLGAVFSQWNGSNLEITLYGPGALKRGPLRAFYHYAFIQLNATRVSANVKRANKRMLKAMTRLGFEFEGTSKRFYGPTKQDDALRFAMFPDTAKDWMK